MDRSSNIASQIRKRLAVLWGKLPERQSLLAADSRRISERSLRGGLIRIFLISAGLTLIVGVVGYFQINAIRDILAEKMTSHANARFYAAQLSSLVDKAGSLSTEYSVGSSENSLLQDIFAQTDTQIRTTLDELKNWTGLTPGEQAAQESIVATYAEFFAVGQDLIAVQGGLETAVQSFESNSIEFKPIRGEIEVLLLDKSHLSLENIYWQMAYHETQFLGQSSPIDSLPALTVDIITLRVALLGSLQEFEEGRQAILVLDNYAIALSQVVAALHQQQESQEAVTVETETFSTVQNDLLEEIQALVDLETDCLDVALNLANTRVQNTIFILMGIVVLAAGIGIGLGLFTAERITRPLKNLAMIATSIAEGDLERTVIVERKDEIGALAQAFNSMTGQLRDLIGSLEQRVADRTADLARRSTYLEAAAQVARDATAIRDLSRLLDQTVRLISGRFGFYHTGIFLVDEAREYAVLQAASSGGGQRMLAREHKLRVGEVGIVGYVAGAGKPRIALDVGKDAIFFSNLDLPDTRSEMALPLKSPEGVIGVLDVQSMEPEAFTAEDVVVLQTLADQITVAISNARLFRRVQESLETERRLSGELSAQAWRDLIQSQVTLRYLCDSQDNVRRVEGEKPVEMLQAFQEGRIVQRDETLLSMPIQIHGQVLGAVRFRKPDHAGRWTAEEIALAKTLIDRLNVALESARLYQDTQRRAAREQLVGEVTARMRETLDVETVLKTAVQEMRRALGLPEVIVRLVPQSPDQTQDISSQHFGTIVP